MDQKLLCEIKIEFVAYPRIPHCLKIHEQLGNTQATVASSHVVYHRISQCLKCLGDLKHTINFQ